MFTACLAFAAVAALVTVTPGVDTMLVMRTTATRGRRAGALAGLGVTSGLLCWAAASAAGVTALLAASRIAFDVLRVAGACYLLWLGGRALWTARRRGRTAEEAPDADLSGAAALRIGLTSNLLNPKVGVFYMSMLPQFVPDGASMPVTSALFCVIHVAETLLWLGAVVVATVAARGVLSRPAVKRRLQQVTGVVFIGFGVRLAVER
jgi:threonine/homoserine/homoserine lactone efflux protein